MGIDRHTQAQIDMARLTEDFWRSEIGQYALGRCEQIITDCKNKLVKVDPDDADAIRQLQFEIYKAGAVPGFFNELLAEGRQALNVIESTDELQED